MFRTEIAQIEKVASETYSYNESAGGVKGKKWPEYHPYYVMPVYQIGAQHAIHRELTGVLPNDGVFSISNAGSIFGYMEDLNEGIYRFFIRAFGYKIVGKGRHRDFLRIKNMITRWDYEDLTRFTQFFPEEDLILVETTFLSMQNVFSGWSPAPYRFYHKHPMLSHIVDLPRPLEVGRALNWMEEQKNHFYATLLPENWNPAPHLVFLTHRDQNTSLLSEAAKEVLKNAKTIPGFIQDYYRQMQELAKAHVAAQVLAVGSAQAYEAQTHQRVDPQILQTLQDQAKGTPFFLEAHRLSLAFQNAWLPKWIKLVEQELAKEQTA